MLLAVASVTAGCVAAGVSRQLTKAELACQTSEQAETGLRADQQELARLQTVVPERTTELERMLAERDSLKIVVARIERETNQPEPEFDNEELDDDSTDVDTQSGLDETLGGFTQPEAQADTTGAPAPVESVPSGETGESAPSDQ